MKTKLITLLMAVSLVATAQSFPFDFESSTAGMVGYDGASFTIVSNPSTVGNTSSNVAKIVKVNAADLWAGGKITSVSSLSFTSASSFQRLRCVDGWMPQAFAHGSSTL